jgi:hypothetical protein
MSGQWMAVAMVALAPLLCGGSIEGRVTNRVTGAGIEGATVSAIS